MLQALEQRLARCPRIHLAAALNAVAFYLAQGYAVVSEGSYPHPCGIVLDCVFMEKRAAPAVP
ncbi:hypothetical protein [Xanthomonas sacchari]|uniref:hypothetical protein n=1 Tax=Xanthomonas sacchari TaxID=56458 RepID=UPI002980C043|nr:hypothetical protein [Xanthomonas sacchari]